MTKAAKFKADKRIILRIVTRFLASMDGEALTMIDFLISLSVVMSEFISRCEKNKTDQQIEELLELLKKLCISNLKRDKQREQQ